MNPFDSNRLHPDDPRLTAYALGELEGDEAAQVAAAIAADPAL
jgi:Ca-activated chloride channel homolog